MGRQDEEACGNAGRKILLCCLWHWAHGSAWLQIVPDRSSHPQPRLDSELVHHLHIRCREPWVLLAQQVVSNEQETVQHGAKGEHWKGHPQGKSSGPIKDGVYERCCAREVSRCREGTPTGISAEIHGAKDIERNLPWDCKTNRWGCPRAEWLSRNYSGRNFKFRDDLASERKGQRA